MTTLLSLFHLSNFKAQQWRWECWECFKVRCVNYKFEFAENIHGRLYHWFICVHAGDDAICTSHTTMSQHKATKKTTGTSAKKIKATAPPQPTPETTRSTQMNQTTQSLRRSWHCGTTLSSFLGFVCQQRVQLQGFLEPTNGGQKYVRNRNSDRTIFFGVLLECREGLGRVALQSASRRAVGHTKTD